MQKVIFPLVAAVGFLAIGGLFLAGSGYQSGLLDLGQAFTLMRYCAVAGISGAGLSIFCILWQRPVGSTLAVIFVSAVFGLTAFYLPYRQQLMAQKLPLIHDISTDTQNPPLFIDVLATRAGAPNPPEYDGAEVAKLQRTAYPDLMPVVYVNNPEEVFNAALSLINERGWTVAGNELTSGRIEATATTRWFGFKDDVVLRIKPGLGGSTVFDMRSKSRVGLSDVGVNAGRIRAFVADLSAELK